MASTNRTYHPSIPLHHQVERLLRARIESGEWEPGEQVPTELSLVRRLGVSRNTIREALATLERDALIVRRRGRGTFVRAAEPPPRPRTVITNLVLGYEAEVRVVRVETVPAPRHVAAFLGLPRREAVRRIVRVERTEGEPLAVIVNYLPLAIGRRITTKDLSRHSLVALLRDRLRIDLGTARRSIQARLPDDEVASLLEIDLTQPVLFMLLEVSDKHGRPVEVGETSYRGDRCRYEINVPMPAKARGRRAGGRGQARKRS